MGWLNTSQNLAKVLLMLALVILLLVAPVFAGEYNGVDQIILTSKYWKDRLCDSQGNCLFFCRTAGDNAGAGSALAFGRCALWHRRVGLLHPVCCSRIYREYILFNLTCGTVLMYQVLLAFTGAVSVTGIALLASALSKNPLLAIL